MTGELIIMDITSAISQLKELIDDRKSLMDGDAPHDETISSIEEACE